MAIVAPGVDVGAAEVEEAGSCAREGIASPVVTNGAAAVEEAGEPVEVPAPKQGERYIFYQSV